MADLEEKAKKKAMGSKPEIKFGKITRETPPEPDAVVESGSVRETYKTQFRSNKAVWKNPPSDANLVKGVYKADF